MDGLSITNTEAGVLSNVQLLPDTNQLGVQTNYAIYFTVKNAIPEDSTVDITFPEDYFTELDQVSCSAIKTAGSFTSCGLADGQSNVIRISDAFRSDSIEENTEVAFLLMNIRNPDSSISEEIISN